MDYLVVKYVNVKSSENGRFFLVFEREDSEHHFFIKNLQNEPMVGGGKLLKKYCQPQRDSEGKIIDIK